MAVLACDPATRVPWQLARHARGAPRGESASVAAVVSPPSRESNPRACEPAPSIFCFRDTAFAGPDPNPNYPDWIKTAHWIWFGALGDSVEFSWAGGSVTSNVGQEYDTLHNTAPYFRRRLSSDGVIFIHVVVDFADNLGDSIASTFEVHRYGPERPPRISPTGQYATLSVVSPHVNDRFSIVPLSLVSSVHDLSNWRAPAGTYKVALVADSLYQLCRDPCKLPDIVKLAPFAKVKRKF